MAVDMTAYPKALTPEDKKVLEEIYHPYAAEDSNDNGQWVNADGWLSVCVLATISATASLNIMGSNAATIPANTSHGTALVTKITASGKFNIAEEFMPKWFKVYVTDMSGGAVTADIKVRKYVTDTVG